jgi:uncharacterized protein DUF5919
MAARGKVRRLVTRIVLDEYLDLYLLAGAALAFTALGFVGLASIRLLTSAIVALLAVVAFSQIRSRRQVADIANGHRFDRLSVFQAGFPDELEARRGSASSLLLIGISMSRTIQGGSVTVLRQMLGSGGKIRVLLLDPADDALMRSVSEHRQHGITAGLLKRRIETTLEELAVLRDATAGDVEIRVASFIPHAGFNVIDVGTADGLIVVQHYEHRPAGQSHPIFSLSPADGFWYQHFAAEAERMWQDGTPWPLAAAARTDRPAAPASA